MHAFVGVDVAKASANLRGVEALAEDATAAAQAQRLAIPGSGLRAEMVQELAREALAARDRLAALDAPSRLGSPATLTRPSSAACRGGHHRQGADVAPPDPEAEARGCMGPRPALKGGARVCP